MTSRKVPSSSAARPQWRPLPEVWQEFAASHPELHVGTAPSARSRFCSRHGATLQQHGALLRSPAGEYFANDKFGTLAHALTLGLPLQAAIAEPTKAGA